MREPITAHVGPLICAWARQLARGLDRWQPRPFNAHVNPTGGGLGGLPTMPPIGFSCALAGSGWQ